MSNETEREEKLERIRATVAKRAFREGMLEQHFTLGPDAADRLFENTPSIKNCVSAFSDGEAFGVREAVRETRQEFPEYFAGSGVVNPRRTSPGQKVDSHADVESESMVTVKAIIQGARRVEQQRLVSDGR